MKVNLMYKNRDFDPELPLPSHAEELIQDLELETLLNAMAMDDKFLFHVSKKALLSSLTDSEAIHYRQEVFKDCLRNPGLAQELYDLAFEALESEKKIYFGFLSRYPDVILSRSVKVLSIFVDLLKKLRNKAEEYGETVTSEGFLAFFSMLRKELSDSYFELVQCQLKTLRLKGGILISAQLGEGNKGRNYTLRKVLSKEKNWVKQFFKKKPSSFSYTVSERDESGARALADIRDRGLNAAASALAQSTDHILAFFTALRTELGFYISCLNLYKQLTVWGAPYSFPLPLPQQDRTTTARNLYDIALALQMQQKISDNTVHAEHKNLVIITGANRGGKSTFLRSIGLAQLMMQSGMFVAARSYSSNINEGIFTHFKREEDRSIKSGKLDEELNRMNEILNHITSRSLLLFNESFAATNEREGSEIARQITRALLEKGIKVFFVTHLYDFAHSIFTLESPQKDTISFLRAERKADTERTFRILEGEPLQTSFGDDIYAAVFGNQ